MSIILSRNEALSSYLSKIFGCPVNEICLHFERPATMSTDNKPELDEIGGCRLGARDRTTSENTGNSLVVRNIISVKNTTSTNFPIDDPETYNLWIEFLNKKEHNFQQDWLWRGWKNLQSPKRCCRASILSERENSISKLKNLLRKGIPSSLRSVIWFEITGTCEIMRMEQDKGLSYQKYVADAKWNVPPCMPEIERDLHRTYTATQDDAYNNSDNLTPLKNLLSAFSVRNKRIGYCQSMNFVAAFLLHHFEEELAFWVFVTLIENILPSDFYASELKDARIEIQVSNNRIQINIKSYYMQL